MTTNTRLILVFLAVIAAATVAVLAIRPRTSRESVPTAAPRVEPTRPPGASAPNAEPPVASPGSERGDEGATPHDAAPSPDVPTVRIRTLTESGGPVRAELFVRDLDERWLRLGTTDDQGRFEPTDPPEFGSELFARADGYQTTSRRVDSLEMLLVLPEATEIFGRVLYESGVPVGAGHPVVAAVIDAIDFGIEDLDAFASGFPSMHATTTDRNGEFTLEGLDPFIRYRFFAGGDGLVTRTSPDVTPGEATDAVEIVVCGTYGVIAEFVEANGRPVAPSIETLATNGGVTCLNPPSPGINVTGGPFDLSGLSRSVPKDLRGLVYVFRDCDGSGPSGALRLDVRLPFYQQVEVEVPLHPVTGGRIPVERVVLAREGVEAFVEVELRLRWSAEILALERTLPWEDAEACGAVIFSRGSRPRVVVPLRGREREKVDWIPAAEYTDVRFVSTNGWCTRHAEGPFPIAIVPNERRTFEFDLTDLGGIVFSVADEHRLGPLIVIGSIRRADPIEANDDLPALLDVPDVAFSTAREYLLAGVPPGRYRIRLIPQPFARTGAEVARRTGEFKIDGPSEVEVQPGRAARPRFSLNF